MSHFVPLLQQMHVLLNSVEISNIFIHRNVRREIKVHKLYSGLQDRNKLLHLPFQNGPCCLHSFIGGGNQSIRRKSQTSSKSMTNFITQCYIA